MPSNEVYNTMQDSRGYLWFATNQGICRFNGYEFTRPVDTSSMSGSAAYLQAEDVRGNIWFTNIMNHSVHRVENDTVRAWKYNRVIDLYQGKFTVIEHLAIAEDGTVWLPLKGLGLLSVHPDGTYQLVPELEEACLIFTTIGGKVVYSYVGETNSPGRRREPGFWRKNIDVIEWKNEKAILLSDISLIRSLANVEWGLTGLRNGDLIFFDPESFFLVRDNRLLWKAQARMVVRRVYESPEGGLFVTSHSGKNVGLFYFESPEQLQLGESKNLLPGHFVTDFICDRQGGWWTTTFGQGIFYCKNPGLDIFDATSGLPSEDVVCLASDGQQTVFAGFRPADICAINRLDGTRQILPRPPVLSREIWTMYFDTLSGRLGCSSPLLFFDKGNWEAICTKGQGRIPAKRITSDPSGAFLWVSASHGFYCIDLKKNTAEQFGEKHPIMDRTFSVTPDREGNLWVTTVDGLRLWQSDHFEFPTFEHPALKFQVSDMKLLPDGGMAISLRGAGLLLRDPKGNFTHLSSKEGLTDDFISGLYIAGDGDVFACSNAGLNRLSRRSDGSWEISTLTVKQGLPSNQVNDVTVLAGEIWVATNKGLARFREIPLSHPMPEPVIEKFAVNNREMVFSEHMHLAHDQNNVVIRFYALHYLSGGDINYRYRLLGADSTFIQSHTREVNYIKIHPGVYTFEVQAQNEDGQWGESARRSFEIDPAWWETGWFRGLSAVLLVAALVIFFENRLRAVRRATETRNKIRDLEAAALRAQMNPHFIFNCLSSIQHFIVEKDPAAATRYLGRFARLVRLALHASVEGQHTLTEEVDMLDNYLALEQLRFQGKFTYEIQTASDLEPEEIVLPPILVQPFVENAILHGMKNKTEGGRIAIAFSKRENKLEVTVTDNGPGFSGAETTSPETAGHKSVGMLLTQHRLEILSGETGMKAFQSENITDAEGKVLGSRVVLRIPID